MTRKFVTLLGKRLLKGVLLFMNWILVDVT